MNRAPRSAGSLIRKIVGGVILIPLAALIIAFAVANRQDVTVSFDPFDPAQPAYSRTTWLFVPIYAALIIGVAIGGAASWLRHGGRRRIARRLEREVAELRNEVDRLKGEPAGGPKIPQPAAPPERLQLQPPAR